MDDEAVRMQRAYYARTAEGYDRMHVAADGRDIHYLGLTVLSGMIRHYDCASVLDVGAGTGRAMQFLRSNHRNLRTTGIEPVAELRAQGHAKGIGPDDLIDGDATRLQFADSAFDAVCCFGVLHHIARPERAVVEMLRVARKLIFISDSNNFGQGGRLARWTKQLLNAVGLWPVANYLKTGGKGYTITEGDGLAYSYSVFQDLGLIRRACHTVHLLNTTDTTSTNLYRGAGHVAVAGIKVCVPATKMPNNDQ